MAAMTGHVLHKPDRIVHSGAIPPAATGGICGYSCCRLEDNSDSSTPLLSHLDSSIFNVTRHPMR